MPCRRGPSRVVGHPGGPDRGEVGALGAQRGRRPRSAGRTSRPRTGTEVTLPSAPETAWTVPRRVDRERAVLADRRDRLGRRRQLGQPRDAGAGVDPLRPDLAALAVEQGDGAAAQVDRATAVKVPGFGGSVTRVAAGSPAVEVRGSMAKSCAGAGAHPTTAAPSWSTSSPLPAATLVATPVSSWPIGTLARANLAWASELTQTPESLRAASCTVEPWLATATYPRPEATSTTARVLAVRRRARPTATRLAGPRPATTPSLHTTAPRCGTRGSPVVTLTGGLQPNRARRSRWSDGAGSTPRPWMPDRPSAGAPLRPGSSARARSVEEGAGRPR